MYADFAERTSVDAPWRRTSPDRGYAVVARLTTNATAMPIETRIV